MPQARDPPRSNGSPPSRSPAQSSRNPPLVIVSERGRHSEASRRIVRAQAARASAAQSRETRARNREDKTVKDGPQSPPQPQIAPPPPSTPLSKPNPAQLAHVPSKPLANWVVNVLQIHTGSFAAGSAMLAATGQSRPNDPTHLPFFNPSTVPTSETYPFGSDNFRLRLPLALPRGFVTLQQRLPISDAFLAVISRTACFDFASPGAQDRLDQLLFDVVMASAGAGLAGGERPYHPIQAHLRIACACLTIFQAQRMDGTAHVLDRRYRAGLEAALAEATQLEESALREPKSAEAALWALSIISVTTGAAWTNFHHLLRNLMSDLQLHYWEHVRTILLEFIYPGSCLDEPCRMLFDHLLQQPLLSAT